MYSYLFSNFYWDFFFNNFFLGSALLTFPVLQENPVYTQSKWPLLVTYAQYVKYLILNNFK